MTPKLHKAIGVVWWCEKCHKAHCDMTLVFDDGSTQRVPADCTA
ncbi:hypothetical protein [Bifidobacterium olomucense]|uniref:Uncharacterized protein n=1 Tax=Bifidobacterium olomucense TaxID=2675324 RepID=A0A7Y0EXC1_9BIFI|nr:hypothetical protein [Bifidobacterium sp. DSM 109959]NMM98142.1 hypothetical protein [Bifidobacterium sp. DSM 109959]